MSAIIVPALALGGVYLLYDGMSKKEKKKYREDTSSKSFQTRSYRNSKLNSSSSLSSKSSLNTKSRHKSRSRSKHRKKHRSVRKTKKQKDTDTDTVNNKSRKYSSFKDINLRKNKTKKSNKDKSRTIYVYYTYGSNKSKRWNYKSLPGGWVLKNKKDITNNSIKYTKLNTFKGPKKNKEPILQYLERAFGYLQKKHIVKYYKITSHKIT
jgi:hypothetical protein